MVSGTFFFRKPRKKANQLPVELPTLGYTIQFDKENQT